VGACSRLLKPRPRLAAGALALALLAACSGFDSAKLTVAEGRLQSKLPAERRLGAFALAQMGPRAAPAAPALVSLLGDADANVRFWSLQALAEIGPAAAPALIEGLRLPQREQRKAVAEVLAGYGAQALPAVDAGSRDKDERVRYWCEWVAKQAAGKR
jgi:HEAT repeat protein